LWATDKPELIPEAVKDLFFEITYQEHSIHNDGTTNLRGE